MRPRFADRGSTAYADFDPATWTARLGAGTAEIAVETEGLTGFRIEHARQGPGPGARLRIAFLDSERRTLRTKILGLRGKVDLRRIAPPGWDGRYACLTFLHESEGRARIALVRP